MANPMSSAASKGIHDEDSDFDPADLKAMEEVLRKKRALIKDYQDFVTKLSKKANIDRLRQEIKDAQDDIQKRQQLEEKLQRDLTDIRTKAAEAAAAKYENFMRNSISSVGIEAAKQLAEQEKTIRAAIEDDAALKLANLDKITTEEEKQQDSYKKKQKSILDERTSKLTASIQSESKLRDEADKKEKARANTLVGIIKNKAQARQEVADLEQDKLKRYIDEYNELLDSGADAGVLAEKEQQIKDQKKEADIAQFKANVTKSIQSSLDNAFSGLANKMKSALSEVETMMQDYNATLNARLQGTGKTFQSIMDLTVKNTAVSPYVRTAEVLKAVKAASDQGVAYNIEQRAFLSTISDKIANTFDAFDSNLTRLVRLQQADTTAARLGMESSLTKFFNEMFQDTSYLTDMYDNVSQAIIDANAQLDRSASAEFEYVVQKWLGSLSSLGMSSAAVGNIAAGINYLATGNVQALAGNNALQTLFAMSASKSGLNYSDLLLQGLNASDTNKLLQSMVTYLKEIAEGSPNKVVRGAYGDIFNLSASDFRAIQNLTQTDISNISSSILSYSGMMSELNNQFNQLSSRMTISEMLGNITNNAMFGLGKTMYGNPVTYAMMKMLDAMDALGVNINIPAISVMGSGIDLNTDVNSLMRMSIGLQSSMQLLGTILGGLGSRGGLNLGSWEGTDFTQRGTGINATLGTLVGGRSSSTYVATGSSRDIKKTALSSATDEAEETGKITNKNVKAEKTFDDFYAAVIGENAKDFIRVREVYLSQAYDDSNKWIRSYDARLNTTIATVFGTTSFFEKRLKVSDDVFQKYSEGNAIRVVDSGLTGVTSALLEVRNATKAQATAKASVQKVTIDEESVKRAILSAIMSTTDTRDSSSLQDVIDLLSRGNLVVNVKPDTTSAPKFSVKIEEVNPSASFNIRR